MKKVLLTLICSAAVSASFSQTLFTFGNKAVSKPEFLQAFNKNPGTGTDRKQALQEYLQLYINFKLKVQAAYDAGLDKDATQQYELQNFKRQTAENIINSKANIASLVNEAFQRSQREIHLGQVLVEVPANGDTIAALAKINAAYNELQEGKDFYQVAGRYNQPADGKADNGDIGYISIFSLPYALETMVYHLKPGSFSAPVKTSLGYHIFKNIDERKPLGSRKVAQILIAVPPNAAEAEKRRAGARADSIYNLLKTGTSFEEMVNAASNDMSSVYNKGLLPEFTAGTYSEAFENAAFSLKNPGEISKPVLTPYGYHILKLVQAKPVSTRLSEGPTFGDLQDKVTKDNRMELARKQFIDSKMKLLQYKPAPVSTKTLFAYTDTIVRTGKIPVSSLSQSTTLFSFGNQRTKAEGWINYVKNTPGFSPAAALSYSKLYSDFVRATADDYYRTHLELYDTNYAKQVREFKDANMLFSIMDKSVWSKATTDTTGMLDYYNSHKAKYNWGVSADAIIVTAPNEQAAAQLGQKLKESVQSWRTFSGDNVTADSGRYELGQLAVVERTNFTPGLVTAPVKNDNDGSYTFNYIINVYRNSSPRSFDDARGMVISDYQQVLEDKWLNELKKKYPVKVNEAVFGTIK